ncbi:MAG: EAL domain-containing protein [Roseitalea sp.]|nr:EAL domain-containing protein [Roseitalea sp.]MBO6721249.1 EAL domain-containing protein [Roseitalea sp.]MBO6742267.1 EAL domain-containing protein [Roseitalea sp.]
MSWRVRFFVVFAAAALVALALAYAAERSIIENWQRAYLTGLAEQTVDRTDIAIDRAVISMGAMIDAGHTRCGFETALASRTRVFETGGIRDIEVRDGVSICRAFNDSGVVPDRDVVGDRWLTARNHHIALARVEHGTIDQLAVRWRLDADRAITAVLNTELLIFDILPASIRYGAAIDLELGAGSGIVSKGVELIEPGAYRTFSAVSSRYPTGVRIRVNESALAAWSGDTDRLLMIAAILAALATGYVVARAFVSRGSFADDFRAAIACGEIIAHYQPIVALDDERPVGFEMLARWRRRDGSFVSPARFIPLVEMNGCADMLVSHLIRQADADLGARFAANRNLRLAVNITPCQLEDPRFVDWLVALVSETGFERSQIVIEVTERQPLTSGDGGHAVSVALQEAGFEIALDDAGTGHNGLSLMKSLCANRVKIDKLFVDEIENDFRTRALVEMLVGVAKELEMGIVAEGIEHREQAVILQTMGIGHGQGYLFARPMPAGELLAYMARFEGVEQTAPRSGQAAAA